MKQKLYIKSNDKVICPLIEKMVLDKKPKKVSVQFFIVQFNMPISVKGILNYLGNQKDTFVFDFQLEKAKSISGNLINSDTKIEQIIFLPQN